MISGLLAKPRQRFKTLSKNRCLPTVPTEALRRLWVDFCLSAFAAPRWKTGPSPSATRTDIFLIPSSRPWRQTFRAWLNRMLAAGDITARQLAKRAAGHPLDS
jgi:hypothetical protein